MQDKQISCKGLMRALILALLLMNSTMMFAQNAVTGQVKDQTGEPLIGVSILEQGTNNGTVTDIDGNFRLNVAQGKTLNISYIGYKTQAVRVGCRRLWYDAPQGRDLIHHHREGRGSEPRCIH